MKITDVQSPYVFISYAHKNASTVHPILKADFIEMTDENTAKFRIRSEFLGGKVFPDSKQAEFYVTKQAASE